MCSVSTVGWLGFEIAADPTVSLHRFAMGEHRYLCSYVFMSCSAQLMRIQMPVS